VEPGRVTNPLPEPADLAPAPADPAPAPADPAKSRRPRWPILVVIAGVVLLVGVAVVGIGMYTSREDPGVTACKMSAESVRTGVTLSKADSDRTLDLLSQSRHENLRRVGDKLATIGQVTTDESAFPDLRTAMTIMDEYTSACAQHGVIIDLSNTPD
jgi:hypothetical protein